MQGEYCADVSSQHPTRTFYYLVMKVHRERFFFFHVEDVSSMCALAQ